jgi:hypothetical protein
MASIFPESNENSSPSKKPSFRLIGLDTLINRNKKVHIRLMQ